MSFFIMWVKKVPKSGCPRSVGLSAPKSASASR